MGWWHCCCCAAADDAYRYDHHPSDGRDQSPGYSCSVRRCVSGWQSDLLRRRRCSRRILTARLTSALGALARRCWLADANIPVPSVFASSLLTLPFVTAWHFPLDTNGSNLAIGRAPVCELLVFLTPTRTAHTHTKRLSRCEPGPRLLLLCCAVCAMLSALLVEELNTCALSTGRGPLQLLQRLLELPCKR